MRFWRIAQRRHALDRSGFGVSLSGGRWNSAGMAALYAGTTISLSALERFVHLDGCILPPQALVAVDVPDECPIFEPEMADLPKEWDALPSSISAQAFGDGWLRGEAHLIMRIPSVIINEEKNVVLNPRHVEYERITLTVMRAFAFDPRMHR